MTAPAPIEGLLVDAEGGGGRWVALEVVHAVEEEVFLEISTADRAELLVIDRADAIKLAEALLRPPRG